MPYPLDMTEEGRMAPGAVAFDVGGGMDPGMVRAMAQLYAEALRTPEIDPGLMTPDAIANQGALGIIPDQQQLLTRQLLRNDALENAPMPQGMKQGAFYTAASPLEFIGNVGQRALGASRNRDITEQQQALIDAQMQHRNIYGEGLAGRPMDRGPEPQSIQAPASLLSKILRSF